MSEQAAPTPGRILQLQIREDEYRPLHVTDARPGNVTSLVTGWALLSPDDLGCNEHGVIPANTPQSPWRAYKNIQEGNAVGQWRWPPRR